MISDKDVEAGVIALARRHEKDETKLAGFIKHMRPVFEAEVRAVLEAALSLHEHPCLARQKLDFLIEEITDREGREGLTDHDFAEQVIALAQQTREALLAEKDQAK